MGWSKWWIYAKNVVRYDPDELGVYELAYENKETAYYGSGKIKTRLLDHINKKECRLARYYRYELFDTEEECREREEQLLEEYKRIHRKLPIYNERIG